MPRGESKQSPILSSVLGRPAGAGKLYREQDDFSADQHRAAIERSVTRFVNAWFIGDNAAMVRCLHPDYVHRLAAIDGRGEPDLLRSAVGVQGHFGSLVPMERRHQEVRILDLRVNSASVVAIMGDWVLQLHLARSASQWSIVKALWELGA